MRIKRRAFLILEAFNICNFNKLIYIYIYIHTYIDLMGIVKHSLSHLCVFLKPVT